MDQLMKAIILSDNNLMVKNVKKPQQPEPGHLIIKMHSSAINSGDKFFLKHPSPPGAAKTLYDIRGASGSGTVLQTSDDIPKAFQDKNVAFYKNLKYSESIVGSWCEYAHIHYLDCVILPANLNLEDYSGSIVNIITPFGFLKKIQSEGHQGIVSTAGNSATGIAMLGFCLVYNFPLVSIVRNEAGKKELEELGAKNIVVQSDPDFNHKLQVLAAELNATAIFDGVGGDILNKIIMFIPDNSVIYSYGYIGDAVPFTFHTSLLSVRNIKIKPFSNFKTSTVQDPENLEKALMEISRLIHMPHFKTKIGQKFILEDIEDALAFKVQNGKKAILYHS